MKMMVIHTVQRPCRILTSLSLAQKLHLREDINSSSQVSMSRPFSCVNCLSCSVELPRRYVWYPSHSSANHECGSSWTLNGPGYVHSQYFYSFSPPISLLSTILIPWSVTQDCRLFGNCIQDPIPTTDARSLTPLSLIPYYISNLQCILAGISPVESEAKWACSAAQRAVGLMKRPERILLQPTPFTQTQTQPYAFIIAWWINLA